VGAPWWLVSGHQQLRAESRILVGDKTGKKNGQREI